MQVTVCSTWDCWYSHSHTLQLLSNADKPTLRSTTRSLKSYSQSKRYHSNKTISAYISTVVSIPRWHETNACTVTPLLEALHHWKTYKPDKKLAFHSFVALNLWSLLTTVELNICHAKGNHLSIIGYSWQMSIKMELNDTQTQISQ